MRLATVLSRAYSLLLVTHFPPSTLTFGSRSHNRSYFSLNSLQNGQSAFFIYAAIGAIIAIFSFFFKLGKVWSVRFILLIKSFHFVQDRSLHVVCGTLKTCNEEWDRFLWVHCPAFGKPIFFKLRSRHRALPPPTSTRQRLRTKLN